MTKGGSVGEFVGEGVDGAGACVGEKGVGCIDGETEGLTEGLIDGCIDGSSVVS